MKYLLNKTSKLWFISVPIEIDISGLRTHLRSLSMRMSLCRLDEASQTSPALLSSPTPRGNRATEFSPSQTNSDQPCTTPSSAVSHIYLYRHNSGKKGVSYHRLKTHLSEYASNISVHADAGVEAGADADGDVETMSGLALSSKQSSQSSPGLCTQRRICKSRSQTLVSPTPTPKHRHKRSNVNMWTGTGTGTGTGTDTDMMADAGMNVDISISMNSDSGLKSCFNSCPDFDMDANLSSSYSSACYMPSSGHNPSTDSGMKFELSLLTCPKARTIYHHGNPCYRLYCPKDIILQSQQDIKTVHHMCAWEILQELQSTNRITCVTCNEPCLWAVLDHTRTELADSILKTMREEERETSVNKNVETILLQEKLQILILPKVYM